MIKNRLSRRQFAFGGAAALSVMGTQNARATVPSFSYDLKRPEDNVALTAKITGSLDDRTTYLQYYGEIFEAVPGRVQECLFHLKGIIKSRWTQTGKNEYHRENFEHGLFCDKDSGAVLTTFRNPFTGEINKPLHYKSGPSTGTLKPIRKDGTPYVLPWRIVGNQISLTESGARTREAYLDPDVWGTASTGPQMQFMSSSTYFADVREVADLSLPTVSADHSWAYLSPFPSWMLMGQRPGYVLWLWSARKVVDESELDQTLVTEIERNIPNFFTDQRPWTENLNSWIQYSKERQPPTGRR